jgi:hypothetical protein
VIVVSSTALTHYSHPGTDSTAALPVKETAGNAETVFNFHKQHSPRGGSFRLGKIWLAPATKSRMTGYGSFNTAISNHSRMDIHTRLMLYYYRFNYHRCETDGIGRFGVRVSRWFRVALFAGVERWWRVGWDAKIMKLVCASYCKYPSSAIILTIMKDSRPADENHRRRPHTR